MKRRKKPRKSTGKRRFETSAVFGGRVIGDTLDRRAILLFGKSFKECGELTKGMVVALFNLQHMDTGITLSYASTRESTEPQPENASKP